MNILWDFDGTLFNTYPAYTAIVKEAIGDTNITDKEIFAQLKISFTDAFQYFQLTEEQIKTIRKKARSLKPKDLKPFPYLEDVLKLADKNVIMTHKEREDVTAILAYHKLDDYFAEMVAGDDGYLRKPHPASYEFLHQKHRIDLVVGDREIDILPAKLLGIKTCLFQNKTPGANYYLNDYSEFTRVVK
ncbi:HAD-IA family hydrolase [Aeromicrobium ponti]|uniref:HAD superfamily hydrolase (TIGR01549 family) n=1 Tax=Cytobacillus oceanisediminis TaxID=665099 RepID=A0A562JRW2_9BACI|nr:HAD-IA family hydrolase [Cytobacillus oceanisediminis]TWH85674.1 HAD superfamily hydrolase (TIGR01549 family) [Cytobacillus oceanisediminis]